MKFKKITTFFTFSLFFFSSSFPMQRDDKNFWQKYVWPNLTLNAVLGVTSFYGHANKLTLGHQGEKFGMPQLADQDKACKRASSRTTRQNIREIFKGCGVQDSKHLKIYQMNNGAMRSSTLGIVATNNAIFVAENNGSDLVATIFDFSEHSALNRFIIGIEAERYKQSFFMKRVATQAAIGLVASWSVSKLTNFSSRYINDFTNFIAPQTDNWYLGWAYWGVAQLPYAALSYALHIWAQHFVVDMHKTIGFSTHSSLIESVYNTFSFNDRLKITKELQDKIEEITPKKKNQPKDPRLKHLNRLKRCITADHEADGLVIN